ncbi:MAG TPA: hypothetical protein VF972_02035 [Actinomycetota bacterium]
MEPSTVWMVHKTTGRAGVRGDLILDQDRLIFRPELRAARPEILGETVFALGDIRKVVRGRGTPLLELHVTTPRIPPVVLFYFVRPPDMYSSGALNPRSAVALYLQSANIVYSEEIASWVEAIREATSARGV